MRAWTYRGLQQIAAAIEAYKAELDLRGKTEDEDVAQRVLNENAAWREFTEATKAFEAETRDPREILQIFRDGRKRYHNYYVFRHGPYTLIYLRDPVEMLANPVLFYHHRDRSKRVKELMDSLFKGPA
jgi:hypothetical protein